MQYLQRPPNIFHNFQMPTDLLARLTQRDNFSFLMLSYTKGGRVEGGAEILNLDTFLFRTLQSNFDAEK